MRPVITIEFVQKTADWDEWSGRFKDAPRAYKSRTEQIKLSTAAEDTGPLKFTMEPGPGATLRSGLV